MLLSIVTFLKIDMGSKWGYLDGLTFLHPPTTIVLIPLSVSQWPFLILMRAPCTFQTPMDWFPCVASDMSRACQWGMSRCIFDLVSLFIIISVFFFVKCQYFDFRYKDKIIKTLTKIRIPTSKYTLICNKMRNQSWPGASNYEEMLTSIVQIKYWSKNCTQGLTKFLVLQFLKVEYTSWGVKSRNLSLIWPGVCLVKDFAKGGRARWEKQADKFSSYKQILWIQDAELMVYTLATCGFN